MPSISRRFVFALFVATALARPARADDPPPPPDPNQSIAPDDLVSSEAAVAAAASCPATAADPADTSLSSTSAMSTPTAPSDAQVYTSAQRVGPSQNPSADPVTGSGEFVITKTHLHFAGFGVPFEVTLNYRSRVNHQSSIGFGWSHNLARHIEEIQADGSEDCEGNVFYFSDRLERIAFKPSGTTGDPNVTSFQPTSDAPLRLEKHPDDPARYYQLRDGGGITYSFAQPGSSRFAPLTRVQDGAGNALVIDWDTTIKNGEGGVVKRVTDTVGRVFYYNYSVQDAQIIPDDVPVQAGEGCGTVSDGKYFVPDVACIAAAEAAARAGQLAILRCISRTEDDCTHPLLSFDTTVPDARAEFDLASVLDAEGNGPSFVYDGAHQPATFLADEQLGAACHTICDTPKTAKSWSCHNKNACGDAATGERAKRICGAISHRLQLQSGGYDCANYVSHACTTPGLPCYTQNWETDRYNSGVKGFFTPSPFKCPYDNGDVGSSSGLPEPLREAACDGWLADFLSYCNDPDPQVKSALDAKNGGWLGVYFPTGNDECDALKRGTDGDLTGTRICEQYEADCEDEVTNASKANADECPDQCLTQCRSSKGAKDASGVRRYAFGRPQDLNHNLTSVTDADGRLVVKNVYGDDPFDSAFDRVVRHQQTDSLADNVIRYDYHELRGELAMRQGWTDFMTDIGLSASDEFSQVACLATPGCTPYYAPKADDVNVTPLDKFAPVDICPQTCAKWGPLRIAPQFVADGMIPWNVIDPSRDGWLHAADPIVLQIDEQGAYDVVLSGEAKALQKGEATMRPGETLPSGARGALVAMALPPEALAAVTAKNVTLQSLQLTLSTPIEATSGKESSDFTGKTSSEPQARAVSPALTLVDGKDVFPAFMANAKAEATPIGTLATTAGEVKMSRSADGRKVLLDGALDGVWDPNGRVVLVVTPDGVLHALSSDLIDRARTVVETPSLQNAIASKILTAGMVCQQWTTAAARPSAIGAEATQTPEHAVVVRDLHGVKRTNYYDSEWRLLREENRTAGETTDYNFEHGTLKAVRAPSGRRTCQQADTFGRPTMVATYPASGFPGDAQPHVKTYAYSPLGGIVDAIVDPGLPTQTRESHVRDEWDRVVYLDRYVDGTTASRTTFTYATTPAVDPHAIFPVVVTASDGSVTRIAFDPTGGGPATITRPVAGEAPLVMYTKYDERGRAVEEGRVAHGSTVRTTSYGPSGVVTSSAAADPTSPGSWLTTTTDYDASQQPSRVVDARIERWLTVDPLDHVQTTIDAPRDGITPPKSTCSHTAPDGLLEYTVTPEGIVTYNTYDPAGRIVRVDRGYPDVLGAWTSACLAGQRAPIAPSLITPPSSPFKPTPISPELLVPDPAPRDPGFKIRVHVPAGLSVTPSPTGFVVDGAIHHVLPPIAFAPSPSWPASRPANDTGLQTVRRVTYAPGGFLVSDVDGAGVGRFVQTDGFGRVIDETDTDPAQVPPATLVHHWTGFDTQGRVAWQAVVGPNAPAYAKPSALFPALQSMVEFSYDGLGRTLTTDRWHFANGVAVGPKLKVRTTIAYDDANRRVVTTVDGHPSAIATHDELGRALTTTMPNGAVSAVAYIELPRGDATVTTEPGPDGRPIALRREYDDQGHLLTTFQGSDELLRQRFDPFGQLLVRTAAQRGPTTYTYDAFGRLLSTSQEASPSPQREIHYAYDRNDRQISITTINAGGAQTTRRSVDGLDRPIQIDDPRGRSTVSDYATGTTRVIRTIDPVGTRTSIVYDGAGRVASQTTVPGSAPGLEAKTIVRELTYAPLGGIATAKMTTSPPDAMSGTRVSRTYDSLGNRISEATTGGAAMGVTHVYDPFGHPIASDVVDSSGASLAHVQRTYDELQRLRTILVGGRGVATLGYSGLGGASSIDFGPRALTPGQGAGVTATLAYDLRGRRIAIDAVNGDGTYVAGLRELPGLDGTPRARQRRFGAQPVSTDVFESDDASRLVKEGLGIPNATLPPGELTERDVDPFFATAPRRTEYTLDGPANWVRVTTERATSTSQIDGDDAYTNVLGLSVGTSSNGAIASLGDDTFVFDALGEMTSATHGSVTRHFAYDALGRRIVETTSQAATPDTTEYLVWDDSALLAMGAKASAPNAYRLRIGGNSATSHLAFLEQLGNGPMYYVLQGNEGSVLALANDAGLVEGYAYSAYGETSFVASDGSALQGSHVSNRLLFQGQMYDPDLSTYAMRAREYRPTIGRFLSADPSGFAAGDNRYAFVNGMPLSHVDTFGLSSQRAIDDSSLQSVQPAPAPAPYTPIDTPSYEQVQTPGVSPSVYKQGEPTTVGDLFDGDTWRNKPPSDPDMFVLQDDSKITWPQSFELFLEKAKSPILITLALAEGVPFLGELFGADAYGVNATLAQKAHGDQMYGNYVPDNNWKSVTLPDGTYVGRAAPGPGNYFTNLDTALNANDPEAYRDLMQVYPKPGRETRPSIEVGVLNGPGGVDVAQGVTQANTGAGAGGGFQYFIPEQGVGVFTPVAQWSMQLSPYGAGLFDSVSSGYYAGFDMSVCK